MQAPELPSTDTSTELRKVAWIEKIELLAVLERADVVDLHRHAGRRMIAVALLHDDLRQLAFAGLNSFQGLLSVHFAV